MISTETGKPIAQSRREWGLACDQFRWYTRKRVASMAASSKAACRAAEVSHQPVGVVGAFTA